MGEIPDEEFKVFMAIARYSLHSGPHLSMGCLVNFVFVVKPCFASIFTARQSWKIF